jgi:hypothetical protein
MGEKSQGKKMREKRSYFFRKRGDLPTAVTGLGAGGYPDRETGFFLQVFPQRAGKIARV